MDLSLHAYELKLRETFSISKGSRDTQPTLIVALSQEGETGLGEAPAIFYYGITVESLSQEAMKIAPALRAYHFTTPEEFWKLLRSLPIHPFLMSALDQAAYDLYGKLNHLPTWKYLGGKNENLPLTSYTLGISDDETLIKKIKATPWPVYKIKLDARRVIDVVRLVRQITDAELRIDANAAWSVEQTLRLAPKLKELGVSMLEQPLPPEDIQGMRRVYEECALPVFADESCQTEEDVPKAAGLFHGVNIKLAKCGGLTPARRMIDEARRLGMKVMLGCMVESSVGISANAQLLPFLDIADLDGALLLSNDPAEGVQIEAGRIFLADKSGNGVHLRSVRN